ncbi:MAG TPA: toll/interleukin-1 receptor domain-containing protein [Pyrinomonadaceae bacterium]|nr:toll/interleukin-1 receptor domain-containing protein [Pyrinomonadaceae bacterium]
MIWLKAVYSRVGVESVEVRSLKATLWGKIPKDFNPRLIDSRALIQGVRLTLYGVYLIDPSASWIEETDKVIIAIRDHLLKNTKLREISSDQIAILTKLPKPVVEVVFGLVMDLGRFWSSASGNQTGGYTQLGIDGEEYFDQYLQYESIEALLDKFIAEGAQRKTLPNSQSWGILKTSSRHHDVFMSYSSQDREQAHLICEAIEAAGGSVFLAEKSLKPGEEFAERIRESLVEANELWMLVTPNSLKSEWVIAELGAAWAFQKKIVPILFRCEPGDLPERLRGTQSIDFHKYLELVHATFR